MSLNLPKLLYGVIPDTPQGIANTLGYLQHHLHELTRRQNISENNINTILAALTA